jgi:hypothetical protein
MDEMFDGRFTLTRADDRHNYGEARFTMLAGVQESCRPHDVRAARRPVSPDIGARCQQEGKGCLSRQTHRALMQAERTGLCCGPGPTRTSSAWPRRMQTTRRELKKTGPMPSLAVGRRLHSEAPRRFSGCIGARSHNSCPHRAGAFAPAHQQPPGTASRRRDRPGADSVPGSSGNPMAIRCQPRSRRTWHSKIREAASSRGRKVSRSSGRGNPAAPDDFSASARRESADKGLTE